MEARFADRLAAAMEYVDGISDDHLVQADITQLIQEVVSKHCARPVIPDAQKKELTRRQTADDDQRFENVNLKIPCSGSVSALFEVRPPAGVSTGGEVETGNKSYAQLGFRVPEDRADELLENLEQLVRDMMKHVVDSAEKANELIVNHTREVEDAVAPRLRQRKRQAEAFQNVLSALDIPLEEVQADSHRILPIREAPQNVQMVEAASKAGVPDWRLESRIAEQVLGTIESFARALERAPQTAERILSQDEETIRDVLLFALNSNFRGAVAAEAFIGHGKTDLSLRWRDRDAFIGGKHSVIP